MKYRELENYYLEAILARNIVNDKLHELGIRKFFSKRELAKSYRVKLQEIDVEIDKCLDLFSKNGKVSWEVGEIRDNLALSNNNISYINQLKARESELMEMEMGGSLV